MTKEKISEVETDSHLRRLLAPGAKSRYEKLTAEMAAIAKGRTAREMRDAQDLESLREWMKRKRESIAILEHKKEVEEEPELEDVEIDLSGYANVQLTVTKKGRMFFQVDKGGGKDTALNEGGEILGEPEYATFQGYEEVGDKVVFVASRLVGREQKYCVVDSELGERGPYDRIIAKGVCDGKLRFIGQRLGKYYDVIDGVEKELKVPDGTYEIAVSREGIFFQVEQDKKYILVNEHGKRISGMFDRVDKMAVVGDRLVVSVQGLIFDRCIDANGDTIGGSSGKIYRPVTGGFFHPVTGGFFHPVIDGFFHIEPSSYSAQVSGQILLTYRVSSSACETVISEKYGKIERFSRVLRIFPIGDRAAIAGWRKNGLLVVFDDSGNRIGGEYKRIDGVRELGGKIAFCAQLPSENWVFEQEGKNPIIFPSDVDIVIKEIVEIKGMTYFVLRRVSRGGMQVFDGLRGQPISLPYVDIKFLTAMNEGVIFAVDLHGQWSVVDRNERKLSDGYDEIVQIKPCGKDKFYVYGRNGQKYSRKLYSIIDSGSSPE